MFLRLSPCVIESTGVGPACFAALRAMASQLEVEAVRGADDRVVAVQRLDRVGEARLERERVGHLDVAPATEAAMVVDRDAPGVARSGRLLTRRPGALLAAGDLHYEGAHDPVVAGLEPDKKVGGVAVAPPLVHVGDREAKVIVLHVRLHIPVELELAREELLPRVAVLAVEGDVGDLGLLRRNGALAGLEVDVSGRADGVEAVDHWAQPLAAVAD